jgi:hypothetical protein
MCGTAHSIAAYTLALGVVCLCGGAARAAGVHAGAALGVPGQTGVRVPVTLSPGAGEAVAGMQFDVMYAAAVFPVVQAAAGPVAEAAGKQVFWSAPEAGRIRVVVAGLNQNAMAGGVAVNLLFSIAEDAPENAYLVALGNVLLAAPDGKSVPAQPANGAIYVGEARFHSADTSRDWRIGLSELLRVIQFFNTGGYCCDPGTEDGYGTGPGPRDCVRHDSDYGPADWSVGLSELLRLIQFFNSGGYRNALMTEDGFAPDSGRMGTP